MGNITLSHKSVRSVASELDIEYAKIVIAASSSCVPKAEYELYIFSASLPRLILIKGRQTNLLLFLISYLVYNAMSCSVWFHAVLLRRDVRSE